MSRNCPTPDELLAFHLGTLPVRELDGFVQHFDECPRCCAALEQLDATADSVLAQLRKPGFGDSPVPPPAPTHRSPDPAPIAPENWPRLPGYEVLGVLGQGGMGIVYRARQTSLNRLVALKRFHAANDQMLGRSRQEGELLARLQHPNIVPVYEVIEHERATYLALELVEGGSLEARLKGKPQAPRPTAELVESLARAIHHAHMQGVVHRDLKPANVLLAEDGTLQHPKVTDFGVAKRMYAARGETQPGDVLGTAAYMAPEQAAGQVEAVGPTADVYALGVILYEMLTGRVPLQGTSTFDTLLLVQTVDPLAPRRLQPQVPRDLETICLKCLQKDPRKRYASAADLADDLTRYLEGRPIQARPAAAWERAWKWAKRRPGMAGLSAAVVLVTAAALALVSWQWLRAEDKARQAEDRRKRAEEAEARLALRQGQALCEQGDIEQGLLWLARALDRASSAGASALDRPARINLAEWGRRLPRVARLPQQTSASVLTFDATGRTLLAAGDDGQVHFWDVQTRRETGPPLVVPRLGTSVVWVGCVAYSPDSRTIATASHGAAVLWDATTRRMVGDPMRHPPGMIWGMSFLPGGRLATISDDGSARVWDLATRRVVLGPLQHAQRGSGYYTLAVSLVRSTLLTAGQDGQAVLWDLGSGKRYGKALQHDSIVLSACFSNDGQRLLTATRGGTLHSWNLANGRATDLPPHCLEVCGLALSPDGQTFATGTALGIVRLWQMETLRPFGPIWRSSSRASGLAFSPDGRRLAIGTQRDGIRVIDLPPTGEAAPPGRIGRGISSVCYSPDGGRLLAGSRDGSHWLDAATGKWLGDLQTNGDYVVNCTALSPDGKSGAMGRYEGVPPDWRGRTEVWDAEPPRRRWVSPDHPGPVVAVAYSPDGRMLFSCGGPLERDGAALWDVATGRRLRPLMRSLAGVRIRQAAFHPGGRELLLACDDGRARVWDVEADVEVLADRPLEHTSAVETCAFDSEGGRVLTGCRDGTVRLWDVQGRRPLLEPLRHEGQVAAAAFSPDGRTMLTGSLDGTARFWDTDSGQPLGATLLHSDGVLGVAFRSDGRRAASAGKDQAVRQWHPPAPPRQGNPVQVRLWAEVLAGLRLDEQGAVLALSAEEIEQRRRQLEVGLE
jgi:WD40 repeat protein